MQTFILRLIAGLLALGSCSPLAAATARHVVVLVWDGMRPDFITPTYAPTLCQLASNGVFFANHHSVFSTATDVNGTAIATGQYPAHSGVIANAQYRPDIEKRKASISSNPSAIARSDEVSGGKFLLRPTLVETLKAAGKTTAVAGTKNVALIHDRKHREADTCCATIHEGKALPPDRLTALTNIIGPFPAERPANEPNEPGDAWTRRALIEGLWKDGLPDYSLLWLSEPDASQHASGPGSARSLEAIRSSDRQLTAVLAELDRRKLREETDVLVVSDHGFSTVANPVDVAEILRQAGFNAQREFKNTPQPGDVLVAGQGGSVFFYIMGNHAEVARRLVAVLQQQEFSGVIFSRENLPGTFTLADGHIDAPNPPDVVLAMRWQPDASANGTLGIFYSDGGRKRGGGNHASLSRFDVHNTLVAAGPDFRKGLVSAIPSANTDVAPTVLRVLGVRPLEAMDGRVLSEAMILRERKFVPLVPTTHRLEAMATNNAVIWRQYLQTSKVGGVVYLDEGNGGIQKTKAD